MHVKWTTKLFKMHWVYVLHYAGCIQILLFFSLKSQENINNSRMKYKIFLDEIKPNPHVGSINAVLKSNGVRHDLM